MCGHTLALKAVASTGPNGGRAYSKLLADSKALYPTGIVAFGDGSQ
jgi:hypothetical protein